jgi:hypothetical protein
MGTITSPGPWNIHCVSGVSVGVKVKAGVIVSVGRSVAVCVGKRMGVNVADGDEVNDGSGLDVQVGVIVGVAGRIRPNPPQLMRKRASAAIPIAVFRK